jgi:Bacterial regulatory proteins, tetR family
MTSQSKNDGERAMPRPSNENQRIRDERHAHILRAAAHVFARKGLMATTISDIAAAALVAMGLPITTSQVRKRSSDSWPVGVLLTKRYDIFAKVLYKLLERWWKTRLSSQLLLFALRSQRAPRAA